MEGASRQVLGGPLGAMIGVLERVGGVEPGLGDPQNWRAKQTSPQTWDKSKNIHMIVWGDVLFVDKKGKTWEVGGMVEVHGFTHP